MYLPFIKKKAKQDKRQMGTNNSARFIYSDLSIIEKHPNYARVVVNVTIEANELDSLLLLFQFWVFPSTGT